MASKSNSSTVVDYLYIFFLATLPVVYTQSVGDHSLLPRQLFLAAFLIITPIFMLKHLKNRVAIPPVLLAALLLLVLAGISISQAYNPVESYAVLMRMLLVTLYFWLTFQALQRGALQQMSLVRGILILAALTAFITLFQLLGSVKSGTFFDDIYAISGTYSHKNLLSSALMGSLPFAIMAAIALPKPWNKGARILLILMVLEVFVLRTRGVWLGIFMAGLLTAGLFAAMPRWRGNLPFPQKWFVGGLAIAVLVLAGLFASPNIKADVSNTANVEKRLYYWSNTWQMIQENPLLGVGAGNWKINFPQYGLDQSDPNLRNAITHIQRPHNDFLWLWAETGILGMLLYMALFILGIIQVFRNLQDAALPRQGRIFNWAALFGLLAYGFFSLGDFPLERVVHNMLFFSLLAIIFSFRKWKERYPFHALVISGLAVVTLWAGFQRFKGQQATQVVQEANANRNATRIIDAVSKAVNPFNNMDDYAIPLRYFSSVGYMAQRKPKPALEELKVARRIAPYNILVHYHFGNTYRALQKPALALAHLDTALRMSPRFESALLVKASLHLDQKNYHKALTALNLYPWRKSNKQYLNMLALAIRGAQQNFQPGDPHSGLINYLRGKDLKQPMDYINAYRAHRQSLGSGEEI